MRFIRCVVGMPLQNPTAILQVEDNRGSVLGEIYWEPHTSQYAFHAFDEFLMRSSDAGALYVAEVLHTLDLVNKRETYYRPAAPDYVSDPPRATPAGSLVKFSVEHRAKLSAARKAYLARKKAAAFVPPPPPPIP